MEKTIASDRAALLVRTPEAFSEPWATIQSNLGNENIETAIACYQGRLCILLLPELI